MDQLGEELKKMLKAGIGAVATGVEKTQEAIESLAQKGEPLYNQAKSAVCDAAGRIKKAVDESGIADAFSGRPKVDEIISQMQEMTQAELDEIRAALEDIYPTRPSGREEDGQDGAGETPDEPTDAPDET